MSPAHRSVSPAISQFRTLSASLARHFNAELELTGGIAAVLDAGQALWAALELCEAENCAYVVRPFMEMPQDDAAATALAARILRLNAVRAARADTCFGSDVQRGVYCLIRRMDLDQQPEDFLLAVQELIDLGKLVRSTLEEGVADVDAAPVTPLLAND